MTLSRRIARLFCIGALATLAGVAGAQSAANYPNKPVRLILPFPAGSSSDTVARIFADRFTKDLGQAFIINNRGAPTAS